MTSKVRRKVDFSTWDVDTAGYVHSVELLMPEYSFEDKLLWDDSGKNTNIDSSGLLPLDVQDWFDDNATGLWFYDVRMGVDKKDNMFYRKMVYTFHFEKIIDATIFKLRWM